MDSHITNEPHPLRPYYRPQPANHPLTSSASASSSSSPWFQSYWPVGGDNNESSSSGQRAGSATLVTNHADYDLPDFADFSRSVIKSFVSRYGRVLVAQPFQVSRMILQVGYYPRNNTTTTPTPETPETEIPLSPLPNNEQDDEINYFTAITGDTSLAHLPRQRQSHPQQPPPPPQTPLPPQRQHTGRKRQVRPHGPYVGQALSAIWALEGPHGMFRGTNITFLYNVTALTLESWISAFLAAALSLPDPELLIDGFASVAVASPSTLASLVTWITASSLAGIILAPIDIARTKLILTPQQDKSSLGALKSISQWTCPSDLVLPTALYKVVPGCVGKLTPYLVCSRIGLDPFRSPALTNLLQLGTSIIQLFVKLPLETILRRAQVWYLLTTKTISSTIVPVGQYTGVASTMWRILTSEDNGPSGWEGLWRGWRAGTLAIFALWGVKVMGHDQDVANSLPEQI